MVYDFNKALEEANKNFHSESEKISNINIALKSGIDDLIISFVKMSSFTTRLQTLATKILSPGNNQHDQIKQEIEKTEKFLEIFKITQTDLHKVIEQGVLDFKELEILISDTKVVFKFIIYQTKKLNLFNDTTLVFLENNSLL
jgi:predicted patatin/cPLA2 family phospholipase